MKDITVDLLLVGGGGGGGGGSTYYDNSLGFYGNGTPGANGGSGIVIIRYSGDYSISQVTQNIATTLRLSYIKNNLNLLNNISISNIFPIFPTSNKTFKFSDLIVSSNTIGFTSNNPAINALEIKTNTNTNINGIYNILCNDISNRTYCLMNNIYDNGGWMMLMKSTITPVDDIFEYTSTYWTSYNTLNVNSLTRNTSTNASDAKFEVFNYVPIKDVLAIFPIQQYITINGTLNGNTITDGWCMHVNNWWYNTTTRVTALQGFNTARDATPSDPLLFSGFSSNLFSTQTYGRHIFGGHTHIGNNKNGTVRWGFIWNNETNWNSCDAYGGIGLSDVASYQTWTDTGRSAGDLQTLWGGGTKATDQPYIMELFGR